MYLLKGGELNFEVFFSLRDGMSKKIETENFKVLFLHMFYLWTPQLFTN